MIIFTTEILAFDPQSGGLYKWEGPHIKASSFEKANEYIQNNGLGYLKITGRLVAEIETGLDQDNNIIANFNKRIDYDDLFHDLNSIEKLN